MPTMLSRRDFLASGIALGAMPLIVRGQQTAANPVFRHGVASGDPLTDRVILWTRVTPPPAHTGTIEVEWTIARDPRMDRAVGRGLVQTRAARDFTVKIDPTGLDPGTTYYYRFAARGEQSPIGRTRTLAASGASRIRFALASCSNLPFGFFNVYGRIAERADLDAVLHLGDYIYEYANANYGNRPGAGDGTALGRVHSPNRELLRLNDYRGRYAQYREDPDLQAAHRQHPFIVIWDDHEFANNAWSGGAQNHNAGEGAWSVRRRAAEQAWREWMPVRVTGDDVGGYRRFTFGGLADLFMLDTRIVGRDQQVAAAKDVAAVERASRHLLGDAQEQWLFGGLRESARARRPWQILGQQIMFAPQGPAGQPGAGVDSWDGYRAARTRVFDAAASAGSPHLVVLTGDVHSSWAYDLARDPFTSAKYDPQTGRGAIGTEIVTPSVTSPSSMTAERHAALLETRPHLRFLEGDSRGYVVVDITRDRLHADWWFVPSVLERSTAQTRAKSLVSEAATPHLVEVSSPVTANDAGDPAP
jgi:alkaline phosphatase D